MRLAFFSLVAVFCLQAQEKPPLSFIEEYIEFRLKETVFTVNGNYCFVNNTDGPLSKEINYPFPVAVSDIDSIHIFDYSQGRFLRYTKVRQAIVFRLNIPSRDTLKLNIFYRQEKVKDSARYILTTTKNWGEPLKKAEYTFETDRPQKIRSFSYSPDKTTLSGNKQKYFWRRKDFLPEKDFVVIFEN